MIPWAPADLIDTSKAGADPFTPLWLHELKKKIIKKKSTAHAKDAEGKQLHR